MNIDMEMLAIKGLVLELNDLLGPINKEPETQTELNLIELNVKKLFKDRGIDYPNVKVVWEQEVENIVLQPQDTDALLKVFGMMTIAQT